MADPRQQYQVADIPYNPDIEKMAILEASWKRWLRGKILYGYPYLHAESGRRRIYLASQAGTYWVWEEFTCPIHKGEGWVFEEESG